MCFLWLSPHSLKQYSLNSVSVVFGLSIEVSRNKCTFNFRFRKLMLLQCQFLNTSPSFRLVWKQTKSLYKNRNQCPIFHMHCTNLIAISKSFLATLEWERNHSLNRNGNFCKGTKLSKVTLKSGGDQNNTGFFSDV